MVIDFKVMVKIVKYLEQPNVVISCNLTNLYQINFVVYYKDNIENILCSFNMNTLGIEITKNKYKFISKLSFTTRIY